MGGLGLAWPVRGRGGYPKEYSSPPNRRTEIHKRCIEIYASNPPRPPQIQRNVARLSEYKEKLVLFPKKKLSAPKKGEASPAEQAAATQYMGAPLPLAKAAPDVASMKVTAELKATMCHSQIRVARTDAKLVGLRAKAKKEKEEAEKEKKNKKK